MTFPNRRLDPDFAPACPAGWAVLRLFFGFFLLLFGANLSASFAAWVYRDLDRVMAPFRGIFTPIELGTTSGNVESVFETSMLFAMIIYAIAAVARGPGRSR